MSNISFSKGVKWKMRYNTPVDYLSTNVSPTSTNYFYKNAANNIVRVNFDMSDVTSTQYMFNECGNLAAIFGLGGDAMAGVTSANNMFYLCKKLPKYPSLGFPLMNLSGVTNADYMFNGVWDTSNLGEVGDISLPSATSTQYMFSQCHTKKIGDVYCPKSQYFRSMFDCRNYLISIGEVDATSCTGTSGPMGSSNITTLTDMGGFKNLKVSWTSYAFEKCPNLTVESLMNIINNLYDWSGNTDGKAPLYDGTIYSFGTTHKMSFGSTNLAKLSEEQIAVATNKGWTLV
jgi:hypothetical protein